MKSNSSRANETNVLEQFPQSGYQKSKEKKPSKLYPNPSDREMPTFDNLEYEPGEVAGDPKVKTTSVSMKRSESATENNSMLHRFRGSKVYTAWVRTSTFTRSLVDTEAKRKRALILALALSLALCFALLVPLIYYRENPEVQLSDAYRMDTTTPTPPTTTTTEPTTTPEPTTTTTPWTTTMAPPVPENLTLTLSKPGLIPFGVEGAPATTTPIYFRLLREGLLLADFNLTGSNVTISRARMTLQAQRTAAGGVRVGVTLREVMFGDAGLYLLIPSAAGLNTMAAQAVSVILAKYMYLNMTRVPSSPLEIRLYKDGLAVNTLTLVGTSSEVSTSRMLIKVERSGSNLGVNFTLTNVSCSDDGLYYLQAQGNATTVNGTVAFEISKPPVDPTLDLPPDLIEYRTQDNPNCSAPDMGYNPITDFSWALIQPDGQRLSFPLNRFSDFGIRDGCTKRGNSTLQANRYVAWNGSQLCCQLVNRTSPVMETCRTLRVLPPVELTSQQEVVEIFKATSMQCLARGIGRGALVELYHSEQKLASYNADTSLTRTYKSTLSLRASWVSNSTLNVNFAFSTFVCADGGNYTCVVTDSNIVTSDSIMIYITRPPSKPNVTIPVFGYPVESLTTFGPNCTVSSLGFYPVMKLSWSAQRPNGTKRLYPVDDRFIIPNPSTCDSHLNATQVLNTNKYTGWNDTEVCCQVTHPKTNSTVIQDCKRILLIQNDYCVNVTDWKPHPYDCKMWVQCALDIVNPNGFCFDGCVDMKTKLCPKTS